MSLAQHVTPTEGFDYEAAPIAGTPLDEVGAPAADDTTEDETTPFFPELDDGTKPEWKQLTFNPIALEDGTEEAKAFLEPHIAAYKVPDFKRYFQVATGVLACWLASGLVFGFAALKPVLIAEGVYSEFCEVEDGFKALEDPGYTIPCPEQDLRLNLFFVVGSITSNVSSLFAGYIVDRWGRRTCWQVASVFLAAGCILLGYSFSIPKFDGYTLGNFFLAMGGTFIFVPSFQLCNAFPKYSGAVVALITGAFDASAAVFLFYRMAYDASGGAISLDKFFFAYLIVPVLILIAEMTYMPPHAYYTLPELEQKIEKVHDPGRDVHSSDDEISDAGTLTRVRSARAIARMVKLDQIEDLVGDAEVREERVKAEEVRQEASIVWGVLHGLPAYRQMMSPWFILILLLTVLQMLRMNYFIATIRSQYRYMLDSEDAAEVINHFFDVALPIGGVASTPFIGILLNSLSVPMTFAIITFFVVVIGLLNCLRYLWAGYATVLAFVIFRPLYYSAISDYATKVFGFATFGRIYGTIVCISGLVNFVQSGLDALTHGPLAGDPTPINVILGAVGAILGFVLTMFIIIRSRIFAKDEMIRAADEEIQQRLLSEEGGSMNGYGTME
ncbi:uncharacterized protein MKZ38_000226 [Zalerion maritima]|uniref:Protein FMP42 n=1 Tax=Zalerion maritima TaxID=339359 RepID=A0AAD5RJA8_9PEZI|nr:uncharacterized protein MKZ38_000226 [Zalerion maritima]